MATRNTLAEGRKKFRVRAYMPKGVASILCSTFVCHSQPWSPPDPLALQAGHDEIIIPASKLPKPDFDTAAMEGAAKAVKTLGDLYAQWGHLVLGSVGQMQTINRSVATMLHRQLGDSEDRVEQLVASILEFRASQLESNAEQNARQQQDDARSALARDALNQLGDAAKVFLSARGLPPEMAEVLGVLGSSPELMEALKDPSVRALMQDKSNLQLLAGMLRQLGQQAQAMKAQQDVSPLGSPPEEPPPPSSTSQQASTPPPA